MSNFCQTCEHWELTYPNGERKFGTCNNVFVPELLKISQDFDTAEIDEPTIFTEACFGCIYYEKKGKDLGVVEIKIT
jgi:hypothetical protein